MTPKRLTELRAEADTSTTDDGAAPVDERWGELLSEALDAYEEEKKRAESLRIRLDAMRVGARSFVREMIAKTKTK